MSAVQLSGLQGCAGVARGLSYAITYRSMSICLGAAVHAVSILVESAVMLYTPSRLAVDRCAAAVQGRPRKALRVET